VLLYTATTKPLFGGGKRGWKVVVAWLSDGSEGNGVINFSDFKVGIEQD